MPPTAPRASWSNSSSSLPASRASRPSASSASAAARSPLQSFSATMLGCAARANSVATSMRTPVRAGMS